MLRYVLLGALVLVQPLLRWPHLGPDVSHRLTLVVVCALLGLDALARRTAVVQMPQTWVVGVAGFLMATGARMWPVVSDGSYFTAFLETSVFSDGALVALSVVWGLWAVMQVPVETWRRFRWLGLAFLEVNLLVALAQWWLGTTHATGLLGIDRALAAHAVAWLPICYVWHPAAALLPGILLVLAHKPLAIVAAVASVWQLCSARARLVLAMGCAGGFLLMHDSGMIWLRVCARSATWWHAVCATAEHPFVGWGFSPMVLTQVRERYGSLLPSLHSDWLMLALGAGWLVALWWAWRWWRVVSQTPRTAWAKALQGSLVGLGALSMMQSTVSHARVASLALALLAWFMAEQREGVRDA